MTEKHSRKWTIQRKERNGIHSFMLGLVTSLQSLIPWPTWQKGQVTNFNEVEAKDLAALPWGDHFYLNSYCVSPSSLHPLFILLHTSQHHPQSVGQKPCLFPFMILLYRDVSGKISHEGAVPIDLTCFHLCAKLRASGTLFWGLRLGEEKEIFLPLMWADFRDGHGQRAVECVSTLCCFLYTEFWCSSNRRGQR